MGRGKRSKARAKVNAEAGAKAFSTPVMRNHKDTMFRLLFKDKANLLSLYNAVNNTHYEDAEQLEIVTLENAVFMNMKNDLAFVMDFYLNIYEHQSTVCPNMPLRDLIYVSKELSALTNPNELYSSSLVKIPTPRFYAFYNGVTDEPEVQTLRLSDAFEQPTDEPELELMVRMLNINKGKNRMLMERCMVLQEYMLFVEKVRAHSKHMELEEAVRRTVDECIKEGILKDFLLKHKKEAIEVCIFEYNEEEAMQYIRRDEYDRGKKAGEEIGRIEEQKKFIIKMLKNNIPDEQICILAECDQAVLEEIKKTL